MTKRKSILALALLAPAPSLGVLAAMVLFPGTMLGKGLFAASKVWLFAFPVVWLKLVDHGHFSLSPVRKGGLRTGLLSGIGIGLLIVLCYFAFGQGMFDRALFVGKMRAIGLGAWPVYVGGAAYWILVNSVLEEYVWRWFVYTRCEALARPSVAVVLSALFFTLHHFVALQTYFSLPLAAFCSLGVFVGGAIWSFLYLRYRSVWPGYLSHAIVDLTVFGIGACLLYGGCS
jgi:hypothetical protein